jgi:hypothetical protein
VDDPGTWRAAANVFTAVAFTYCCVLFVLALGRAGGMPLPWWRTAAAVAALLLSVALVIVLGAGWAAWRASTTG